MANARVQPSNLAPRLLTSLRMQAIEYRRRAMLLLLVIALPVAFWAATYYSTGSDLVPVKVPERTRTVELAVPLRETFPVDIGLMGVAWSVAAASFFSVTGSLERDRRLVLCGYGPWQILLARLGLLACVSVVLAFAATLIFAVLTFSLHPELTWLAAFLAGLIAAGTGLFLGTLLPRPTEGMLIIIGLFGIGMSLGEEASRYFFMYPTQQLLRGGSLCSRPVARSSYLAGAANRRGLCWPSVDPLVVADTCVPPKSGLMPVERRVSTISLPSTQKCALVSTPLKLATVLSLQALLLILYLIAFSSPAYAHPDFPIADKTVEISPGRFVEFPLSVHFHRVVGSLEVISPEAGTVTALLMDDQAFARYAAGQAWSPLYSSGRTDRGKLNYVIACCRIVLLSGEYRRELTYTPYHLVLDNTASPSSVTVRLRADLLHDGLAVIVHVAEPFGIIPLIGFFGAIGVGMSVFMRRKIRAATPSSPYEARQGPKILLLSLGSLASFVVLSLLMVNGGMAGMSSYGGSFIDGLIAIDAPSFEGGPRWGPAESLIPLSWLLALLFWLGAFGAAVSRGSRLAGMIGIGEGLGWLGFWLLVAVNYGSVLVPAVLAGLISLPQVLGSLYLIQRSRRKMGYQL